MRIEARHKELVDLALFYTLKLSQLAFPLFSVYLIVHRMSSSVFGYIILAQSIAFFSSYVVEYGFTYSGARDIGIVKHDMEKRAIIFNSIFYSKILLSLPTLILSYVLCTLYKLPDLFFIGVLLTVIGLGFNTLWYFQGISEIKGLTIFDATSKIIVLVLIYFFVKNITTAWLYLFFLGANQVIQALIFSLSIFSSLGIRRVTFSNVINQIKDGFHLFVFRMSSLIYSGGSNILLASVVPTSSLAIYGLSDRIFRATSALTGPIGDAYFAKISGLESEDRDAAKQMRVRASILVISVATTLFFVLQWSAEFFVNSLFGVKYGSSIEILRILALDLPLIGVGTVIFVFYLLPKKEDKVFSLATILAAVWTVLSIFFLVPKFGLPWMAWTIVIAEVVIILTGSIWILRMRVREHAYQT